MNKSKSTQLIQANNTKSSGFGIVKKELPIFNADSVKRNWLKKHGKSQYIDFDDAERRELRKYFDALDADKGGSIGIDELEDPLIGLGLVSSREEVEKIVSEVDDNGDIEFTEFLKIMSNIQKKDGGNQEESILYRFFKDMINGTGKLMKDMDKTMPFLINVSNFRRRKLMDGIMNKDREGMKILTAYKKQLVTKKTKEKVEKGENPNELSIEQPPSGDTGLIGSKAPIFKASEMKTVTGNLLLKPSSIPIQTLNHKPKKHF